MSIGTARRRDGGVYQYLDQPLGEGGMKIVYPGTDGYSVVGLYKHHYLANDPSRLIRLEAVLGRYNPTIDAASGTFWQQVFCWPTAIVTEPALGVITPKFPENYYFASGPFAGKEKQATWFCRPRLRGMLAPEERGPWVNYLRIAIQLARAVRRLHQAGLAHADLSPRNVLIDPLTGSACIIDIDSLVVPGLYPPEIIGTPGYIAPEVLSTMHLDIADPARQHVSTRTDQHALAVLLYEYLLYRHPLRGPKVHDESPERDEFLSMGPSALYIEHPADHSNRPSDLGQASEALGPILARLFRQAFIDGLHTPEDRPSAIEWERGLVRTWDRLIPCSNPGCFRGHFILPSEWQPRCPYCGTAPPPTPVLTLQRSRRTGLREDGTLVLYDRNGIFPWHAYAGVFPGETGDREPLAHAVYADGWRLVNDRLPDLTVITDDGDRSVPLGTAIPLTTGTRLRLAAGPEGRLADVQLTGG